MTKKSISSVNEKFLSDKIVYDAIQKWIELEGDLSPIGLKCYIWNSIGHICLNWSKFFKIQGNLVGKFYDKNQAQFGDFQVLNSQSNAFYKIKTKKNKNKFNEEAAIKW